MAFYRVVGVHTDSFVMNCLLVSADGDSLAFFYFFNCFCFISGATAIICCLYIYCDACILFCTKSEIWLYFCLFKITILV